MSTDVIEKQKEKDLMELQALIIRWSFKHQDLETHIWKWHLEKVELMREEVKKEIEDLRWVHDQKTASEPTPNIPDGNGSDHHFAVVEGWNKAIDKILSSLGGT